MGNINSTIDEAKDRAEDARESGEDHRSREQKLKALIKKDLDPDITATAKRALERRQQLDDRGNE